MESPLVEGSDSTFDGYLGSCGLCGTRRFKIYTKTGDKGQSSLYNGERRDKTDLVFAALGDVDELNAHIGVAVEHCRVAEFIQLTDQLAEVQSRLLDVGSAVATPMDASSDRKIAKVSFDESAAERVEGWIDSLDEDLPQLTQFILPSGGLPGAHLHVARAVCRRAERAVVALGEDSVPVSVRVYLNRLSDYFFTAARWAALKGGHEETTYKKLTTPESKAAV